MPSGSGSTLIWAICFTASPNSVKGRKKVPACGTSPFRGALICHTCLLSIRRSASLSSRWEAFIIFLSTAIAAITASFDISITLVKAVSSALLYLNNISNATAALDSARTSRASVKAALVSSLSERIPMLSSVTSTKAIRRSMAVAPLDTRSFMNQS